MNLLGQPRMRTMASACAAMIALSVFGLAAPVFANEPEYRIVQGTIAGLPGKTLPRSKRLSLAMGDELLLHDPMVGKMLKLVGPFEGTVADYANRERCAFVVPQQGCVDTGKRALEHDPADQTKQGIEGGLRGGEQ
jgi:hypothetical protein